MRGALRVMVLLFTALSVQRVLLGLGALLLIVGCFVPEEARAVSFVAGLVVPLVPTLFAGGILLRYFIAPRHMRLIPGAREQVLGGMLLSTVANATLGTVVAGGVGMEMGVLPVLWLRIAAATSVLMLSQFIVVTSVVNTTLWFLTFVVLMQPKISGGLRDYWTLVGNSPGLLAAIFTVSWAVFAAWFLRARALATVKESFPKGDRVLRMDRTRATAIRTLLLGSPSIAGLFGSGVFVVAILTFTMAFVSLTTQSAPSVADTVSKSVNAALILAVYAGVGGFIVVRRSKALWLGGRDRLDVFRICEAQAWISYAATLTPLLLVLAVACVITSSLQWPFVATLGIHACTGTWVLYLGLMWVRGWRAFDVVTWSVLLVAWVVVFANVQFVVDRPWTFPIVIAAMVSVALALRLVAVRRWRSIDWLVCKPPRQMPRGFQSAA
jgi:hypothetical protein